MIHALLDSAMPAALPRCYAYAIITPMLPRLIRHYRAYEPVDAAILLSSRRLYDAADAFSTPMSVMMARYGVYASGAKEERKMMPRAARKRRAARSTMSVWWYADMICLRRCGTYAESAVRDMRAAYSALRRR